MGFFKDLFKVVAPIAGAVVPGLGTAGRALGIKEFIPGATAQNPQGVRGAQPGGILPGGPQLALPPLNIGGAAAANQVSFPQGVQASPFGGKFVALTGRAADAFRQFEQLPVQGVDVISLGQADDRETAKLAVKHAVIPAASDLGMALVAGGATVSTRSVRMSDGTTMSMQVVEAKGARKRRRRNYATPIGIRNAGRTMRQMGQIVRTYKTLAKQGAKIDRALSPKRATCCPPKRAPRKKAC